MEKGEYRKMEAIAAGRLQSARSSLKKLEGIKRQIEIEISAARIEVEISKKILDDICSGA